MRNGNVVKTIISLLAVFIDNIKHLVHNIVQLLSLLSIA